MRRARYLLFPAIIALSMGSFFLWTQYQDDPKVSPKIFSLKPALSFESHEIEGAQLFRARGVEADVILSSEKISFGFVSPIEMKFVGGNKNLMISGEALLEGKSHYLIGNDQSKWKTNISHVNKVRYHEVYPGIDVVFYGNQGEMEYDFIVKPGADPKQIEVAYEDIDSLNIDEQGNAVITSGENKLINRAPKIYQEIEGKQRKVDGRFELTDKKNIKFVVAAYDHEKKLIIDPRIEFSMYLGGAAIEEYSSVALDGANNIYLSGKTHSHNLPLLQARQTTYGGGSDDVFVMKWSAQGQLIYSTYLGGQDADVENALAVDRAGNVYITGHTQSPNFPTHAAVQSVGQVAGPNWDAFVTKLDPQGRFIYSTYLGGRSGDRGLRITTDASGNAYVTGETISQNFPVYNPLQLNIGGQWDIFVTKFDSQGRFVFSTYLGGNRIEDYPLHTVDSAGNIYIVGYTESSDLRLHQAFQSSFGGGGSDIFIIKLNPQGQLIYCSYLGGEGNETREDIFVDPLGNAYITGNTNSHFFPIQAAVQSTLGIAPQLAFVRKINPQGSLTYSTYFSRAHFNQ